MKIDKNFESLNHDELNNIVYEYKHKIFNKFLNNNDNNILNDRLTKILIKDYLLNIDKNILLIPSMLFRMSNLNSGDSIYYISKNIFIKSYAAIIIIISQFLFLLSIILFFYNLRYSLVDKSFFFILPSFFYLIFYSIFSMGLPRFGLVVYPSLLIFLLLTKFLKHVKIK